MAPKSNHNLFKLLSMEIKKNPNADLDKKSGLFLNIGLCVSLLLVITALHLRS